MRAVDLVAERLRERGLLARQSGEQYASHCPAHDYATPSLRFRAGDRVPVALYCHAGCEPDAVIAALRLSWRDLRNKERSANEERRSHETSFSTPLSSTYTPFLVTGQQRRELARLWAGPEARLPAAGSLRPRCPPRLPGG